MIRAGLKDISKDDLLQQCKAYSKKKLHHLKRDQHRCIECALEHLIKSTAMIMMHIIRTQQMICIGSTVSWFSLSRTSETGQDDYKHAHFDQQRMLHHPFDGKNLVSFCNDILVTSLMCHNWTKVINITTTKNTKKNVIRDFMLITEDYITLTKATQSTSEESATMNMYMMSWSTFDKKVMTSMQSKEEKYSPHGLTLLYFMLQTYTGSTETIIRDQLQWLNDLTAKFKSYNYNISSFSDYVDNFIKTLESASGTDKQAPEKSLEALTSPVWDSG
eukprot:14820935-Ditylum_brightwellii.AAC.1